MAPQSKPNNATGIVLAICAYLSYSCYDALMKLLGGGYSPFQISFFAGLIVFIPMVMYSISTTGAEFKPQSWRLLGVRCFNSALAGPAIIYALSLMPLTQFYAIIFITPSIITVLSVVFLKEKIYLPRITAIAVGFVGVLIVLDPTHTTFSTGHFVALIIPVTGAVNAIIMRTLREVEHPVTLYILPALSVVLVSGSMLPFSYKPMPIEDFGVMVLIGLMGMVSGLLLQFSYRKAEASLVAPIQYTQLFWAILIGAFFFDEIPQESVYYGMPFIVFSGAFILWRERVRMGSQKTVTKSYWRLELGNSLARPDGTKPPKG